MMSPRHADLFRLWSGMRGRRAMPRLSDVTPRALGAHLQDLLAIEPDARGDFLFRYAGSALCAHFARELTNETFTGLWREKDRGDIQRLCEAVFGEASPVVIGARGQRDGFPEEAVSCLLLPVAGDSEAPRRIIGSIAEARSAAPCLFPVKELRIVSIRMLGEAPVTGGLHAAGIPKRDVSLQRGHLVLLKSQGGTISGSSVIAS